MVSRKIGRRRWERDAVEDEKSVELEDGSRCSHSVVVQ